MKLEDIKEGMKVKIKGDHNGFVYTVTDAIILRSGLTLEMMRIAPSGESYYREEKAVNCEVVNG